MKTTVTLIYNAKRIATILTVAMATLVLSSCKDDKDKEPSNYFAVNDSKKAVKEALFIYDTQSSESPVTGEDYYRHELVLYSDGFTLNTENNRLIGNGDAVDLMITGGSMDLDPGTDTFTATEEDAQTFEVWDASVYVGYSTSTKEGEVYVFKTGQLKVTKDGEVYTFDFAGTAYPANEDSFWGPDLSKPSKSIKGYYKGTIARLAD